MSKSNDDNNNHSPDNIRKMIDLKFLPKLVAEKSWRNRIGVIDLGHITAGG
ncbi:MAG TPA: hypothetical protein VE226_00285 [Nitrososphaeraceae archaeon]|nr:hypothetical protein [Nitrososphaeraceae archaeon]